MDKLNYLNVGCGDKINEDWINIDLVSNHPNVVAHNLFNGIPYKDNTFDVVYHSQVLEHFPKEKAVDFIKECYRVLKPSGILRVVVPDLENIVDEYKKYLNENLTNENEIAKANYDWIMLEMYDQTVRNDSGGKMAEVLKQPESINEKYIIARIGFVARLIKEQFLKKNDSLNSISGDSKMMRFSKMIKENLKVNVIRGRIFDILMTKKERQYFKTGKFRHEGEIHYWMYDRYSLKKLLQKAGFVQIEVKSPFVSNIPDWSKYELDVKNGDVYDPTSLFMEGRKASVNALYNQ